MTLGEVSKAMADISGLTKEDILPMFMCPTKTEEVSQPTPHGHIVDSLVKRPQGFPKE